MRYIEASDSGIAVKKGNEVGAQKSIFQRLGGYLASGLRRGEFDDSVNHSEVNELYGAKISVSNGMEPSSGMAIHRARLANLNQAQAHQACQKLISMRLSCFVIKLAQGENL